MFYASFLWYTIKVSKKSLNAWRRFAAYLALWGCLQGMDAIVYAFASGKGGTGKSAVASLTGAALAAMGRKVLLIELAGALRNIDVITGTSKDTVYDLNDVLSGQCAPYKAVVKSPLYPGLFVIAAPYAGGQIGMGEMQQLCTKMSAYFDYILLDVASGLGDAFDAAGAVAHRMALVLTPDPLVMRAGRYIADNLPQHVQQLHMLINMVPPQGLPEGGVVETLDQMIDQVGVQLLGVIPQSDEIFTCISTGRRLPEGMEKKVFEAVAGRIEGMDIPLLVR